MRTRDDTLNVHLLGGFSVEFGVDPMPPLPSRVGRLLASYLLLRAGRPQPRSVLVDVFWPDVEESRGRRRLSHVLWQLQDALAEAAPGRAYLQTPGDAVLFGGPDAYWLDVEEFETRLDRVDSDGRVDAAAERELRRCVELYRGDLLAGHYEPWVIDEQQRLEHRYLTALTRLVEACKQQGNFHDALTFARRVTHQSPLREDGHREVMRLCVLLGQPSLAMEQFERCRSVLLEELGTEPDAETMQLHERVRNARAHATPARDRPRELVSRRLVGRDDERTRLLTLLDRALGGRGGTALVEGEPGVGKSHLLSQLADDARWRGFSVLWGACSETMTGSAYAPIRDALDPELQPVRVAQLRHNLPAVWMQEAAALLPALGTSDTAPPQAHDPERASRMREALVHVATGLSALAPTLWILEDLQWADEETLELLEHWARRQPPGRLLLVLTCRDDEARSRGPVWAALRSVDRDARPERLALAPLSVFETGHLVAELLDLPEVPTAFVTGVHRESGGNPLYVLEILRALRDVGSLPSAGHARLDVVDVPVTDGLRALVSQRLRAMSPHAHQLLELGSVIGTEFPVESFTAPDTQTHVDAATALDELLRHNLIEQTAGVCTFTHAVTRRVVLDEVAPDRLPQLHLQAAQALEQAAPDQVERLASHLLQAGAHRRALPYLAAAADRALSLHAYATAAHHLAAATEAIDQVPASIDERYTLTARYEQVLDVLGRRDDQDHTLSTLERLATGDTGREIEVLLRRAVHLGHLDRFEEAERAARAACVRAAPASVSQHAAALSTLGQTLSWAGNNTEAIEALRQAVALADPTDPALGQSRFALGTALRLVQRYGEAEVELRQAHQIATATGDDPGVVRSLGALADLHNESGRPDHAKAAYDQAIAIARRIGYRQREGVSLVNLANLLQFRGDPAGALDAYHQAEVIFAELDSQRGTAMTQLNRAWLHHRWFGDDDAATRDAQHARRYFAAIGNHASEALCLETLAAIARRRGDLPQARELLALASHGAAQAGDHRAQTQVDRGLAETSLADHDPATALEHLQQAHHRVEVYGLADLRPELAALEAVARLANQQPDQAWTAAADALALVQDSAEPHRLLHRVATVAAALGHHQVHADACFRADTILQTALAPLPEHQRQQAIDRVPSHRAITQAAAVLGPRKVTLHMAAEHAPRGRPLGVPDLVAVEIDLGPVPTSRTQRQHQLLDVIRQARAQQATPTVADLAALFDVSPSTVHRDLRHLRQSGQDAATRGTGVG